jgi:predicted N-acyltransferase
MSVSGSRQSPVTSRALGKTSARAVASDATGKLQLVGRAELAQCEAWPRAFAAHRKDHRFYELVEDTLPDGFDYRYLALSDGRGAVRAVQPCFVLDQDLLAGAGPRTTAFIRQLRRLWPRLLVLRTLMVGCVAGEGHLDGEPAAFQECARVLAEGLPAQARALRAPLIVLKEFPSAYREPLAPLLQHGFTRIPSLPMTRLNIRYRDFDEYMHKALNSSQRRKLKKKLEAADAADPPLRMSVTDNLGALAAEVYPLYLAVFQRSALRFEKLTPAFLAEIGARAPDKVRFFIWRQAERIVAFSLCMLEGSSFFAEYVGFDYAVAFDLHLYHRCVRDMTSWAIAGGFREFRSSGLNYDPKLHLRHWLDPIDLYVRHLSPPVNALLSLVLPLIEPTRQDPVLERFPNYADLRT